MFVLGLTFQPERLLQRYKSGSKPAHLVDDSSQLFAKSASFQGHQEVLWMSRFPSISRRSKALSPPRNASEFFTRKESREAADQNAVPDSVQKY
ncbi:hypothetical protein Y032_0590g391 [Ancylostoma ceylanicum]|uniref:Uncharacterized protein n=1 Tax=Ancylostoma ceylanicum TaxID=53326 RepID=A0A016WMM8_9BILA|nr:hypothetical protein Y032_0590g391 [Ancylostoma ceylanicum]